MNRHSLQTALWLFCVAPLAYAGAQDEALGFIQGSGLSMRNRVVSEGLDFRRGNTTRTVAGFRSDRASETGYGVVLNLSSGYTRGWLGFGMDAHAHIGVNLGSDADHVRSTPRYIAKDGTDLQDAFGRVGGAAKLRWSSTELKYGELRSQSAIFHSSDSRLLPETNRGWLITSQDVPQLSLQAGRFTRWTDRNARKNGGPLLANYSGVSGKAFSFVGGTWTTPLAGLSASSYWGQYQDVWNVWYLGAGYRHTLASKRTLALSLNAYRSTDTGQAKAGAISTTTWSLMGSYSSGPHKLGLGYQKVAGNTPFDYVNRGSIWLDNAMQLSDFNGPHESSWQIKYDADLGNWIAPGLSAGLAYTRGSGIDWRGTSSVYASYLGATGSGGKHWERDVNVRYIVQQGAAKGLAIQMRWGVHRVNAAQGELNVDQLRLQVDMPLSLL